MALKELQGFDHQAGDGDLVSTVASPGAEWKWSILTLAGTLLVPGQFSGQALALGSTGLFGGFLVPPFTTATVILGCAVKIPVGGNLLTGFWDSATQDPTLGEMQLSMLFDDTRAISLYRGSPSGSLLHMTGSNQFPANSWFYIEIKARIDPAAGAITLRLRGHPYLAFTGLNTQNGLVPRIDGLFFGGGGQALIDHIYIADTVTGPGTNPFNDFQATPSNDLRIFTRFPSGPGIAAQFTPLFNANWQMANEHAMDADVTYNYDSGAPSGHKDLFAADSLPHATPLACKVVGAYRQAGAGAYRILNKLRSSSTEVGGAAVSLLPDYTYQGDIYPLDPAISAPWVEASVSASQIGYEVAFPLTFGIDAVVFDGSTFLWGFPAMSDSPVWSLSVWLYMSGPQLTSLGWAGNYVPDLPDGDLNRTNLAYLLYNPSNFNDTFLVSVGNTIARYGGTPGSRLVNPITDASSANPIVITFTHPHGITSGSYVTPIFFNQTGWESFAFSSGNNSYHVTSTTSSTITLDFDSTGFPAFDNTTSGPNQTALFQIYNSTNWYMSDGVVTNDFDFKTTAAMPPGAWVNLLASGNTNLASGSKILNLYYGDTAISPDGSAPTGSTGHEGDISSAFSIKFSESNSGLESDTWQLGTGGSITNGGIICYMAEFWFAPGQYIDFTNPANRALFHNGSNAPEDLGSTGATPTGTAPAVYLSVRSGGAATDFLINRAGGSPLSLNSGSDPFVLAPSHP